MHEMWTEQARKLVTTAAPRTTSARMRSSLLDAGAAVTGRLLLESASLEARSLEGRPLAMSSSLMLPDRSRLRLLDPRRRLAAAFGEQKRPMLGPASRMGSKNAGEMIASRHDDLCPFLARARGGRECGL
jgi:hypothetical protein